MPMIAAMSLRNVTPEALIASPESETTVSGSAGGAGHDHHGLVWRLGRLWPVAMVDALAGEVAHLALDHPRQGAQPARGQ